MTGYSPIRFFVSYLTGKAIISVAGAYLGRQSALTVQGLFPTNEYIVATAVVSILIASVLLKADLPTLMSRLKKVMGHG